MGTVAAKSILTLANEHKSICCLGEMTSYKYANSQCVTLSQMLVGSERFTDYLWVIDSLIAMLSKKLYNDYNIYDSTMKTYC